MCGLSCRQAYHGPSARPEPGEKIEERRKAGNWRGRATKVGRKAQIGWGRSPHQTTTFLAGRRGRLAPRQAGAQGRQIGGVKKVPPTGGKKTPVRGKRGLKNPRFQ